MVEPDYVYTNALVRNAASIQLIVTKPYVSYQPPIVIGPSNLIQISNLIPPQIPPVVGTNIIFVSATGAQVGTASVVSIAMSTTTARTYLITLSNPVTFNTGTTDAYFFQPPQNIGVVRTDVAIPFSYTEQRNNPILGNAIDYEVCVEQFRFPTLLIPIMVCPDAGRNLGYVTIYKLSTDSTFTATVEVSPDNTAIVPTGVYQISTVVTAVNLALAQVWLFASPGGVGPPQIVYDQVTGLFSLYAPQGAYYPDNAFNLLIFSGSLYKLFNSIPAQSLSIVLPDQQPPNIYGPQAIQVRNEGTNAYVAPGPTVTGGGLAAGTYWIMSQTSISLTEWDDFASIVITSSLPVAAELLAGVSNDEYLGPVNSFNPYQVTGGSSTRPVLYEHIFSRPMANATDFRKPAIFVAGSDGGSSGGGGGRRYLRLNSNQPLTQQSYFAYWQDKRSNLFPLLIADDDYGSVKMQFRKVFRG